MTARKQSSVGHSHHGLQKKNMAWLKSLQPNQKIRSRDRVPDRDQHGAYRLEGRTDQLRQRAPRRHNCKIDYLQAIGKL